MSASPDRHQRPSLESRIADGGIDCWIFDLDNTLYPSSCKLFDRIDVQMGAYIRQLLDCDADTALRIQKDYFHDHGTTLAGLMHHHGIEPQEFLDFVHDIDLSPLDEAPRLADRIAALPGRKLVFTNGDAAYARRVLERLDLADQFDGMHDILACDLVPKPQMPAYETLVRAHDIDPQRSLFVEDMARNLVPAHAMGMGTVWINCGSEWGARNISPAHIDIEIADLPRWLDNIAYSALGNGPNLAR